MSLSTVHTKIYQYVLVRTSIYQNIQVHTKTFHYIAVHTSTYYYVLECTSIDEKILISFHNRFGLAWVVRQWQCLRLQWGRKQWKRTKPSVLRRLAGAEGRMEHDQIMWAVFCTSMYLYILVCTCMYLESFSVLKHLFTLIYVGGGPMRGCLLLSAVCRKKRHSQVYMSIFEIWLSSCHMVSNA